MAPATSDNAAALLTSEHVIRADATAGNVANVNYGFSFSAVTRTGDGDDDGSNNRTVQGSLRQFIQNSNAITGIQTSNFSIGGGGAQTIAPTATLPTISDAVVLDATTQEGFGGMPLIVLDGNDLVGNALTLTATADGSTIRGLVIRDFGGAGIRINSGSDNNLIAGNYIGSLTAAGGDAGVLEGLGGDGIDLRGMGNTIGGTGANDGNVIAGNAGEGIDVNGAGATNNVILGNRIGTDAAGTIAIANGFSGIRIQGGAGSNTIGGTAAGSRNLLSGNSGDGISINGGGSNVVLGNYIGVNASGNVALRNDGDGIGVTGSANNTIGGTTAAARNVISGNGDPGNAGIGIILSGAATTGNVISGNYIGTGADGVTNVRNDNEGIRVSSGATNNTIGGAAGGG